MLEKNTKWVQIFVATVGLIILLLLLIVSVNRYKLEVASLHKLNQVQTLLTKSLAEHQNLAILNDDVKSLLASIDSKTVKGSSPGSGSSKKSTQKKPAAKAKAKPKAEPVDNKKVLAGLLTELKTAKELFAKKEKDKAVAMMKTLKKKTWELSTKLEAYKAPLQKLMGIYDQVIGAWSGGKEHPAIKSIQGTYDGIIGKLNNAKPKK